MPRKKTHEEFIKEYSLLNKPVKIIGKYDGIHKSIECKCTICGDIFKTSPYYLLKGHIHKKCAIRNTLSKTNKQFRSEFKNDNIILDGKYTGALNKIDVHCKICGHRWSPIASNLLNGHGCPVCAGNYKYNHEEFIKRISSCQDGHAYDVLSQYSKSSNKIKFLHKKCGNVFEMIANNFLQGQRCPYCNESKGEQKIRNFLNTNKINYDSQYTYDDLIGVNGGLLSYDFILYDYNLLIEYQGQFHDGKDNMQNKNKFAIQKEHDKRKHNYAEKHNIKLLEIWYWDFDNIEQILNKELNL